MRSKGGVWIILPSWHGPGRLVAPAGLCAGNALSTEARSVLHACLTCTDMCRSRIL